GQRWTAVLLAAMPTCFLWLPEPTENCSSEGTLIKPIICRPTGSLAGTGRIGPGWVLVWAASILTPTRWPLKARRFSSAEALTPREASAPAVSLDGTLHSGNRSFPV